MSSPQTTIQPPARQTESPVWVSQEGISRHRKPHAFHAPGGSGWGCPPACPGRSAGRGPPLPVWRERRPQPAAGCCTTAHRSNILILPGLAGCHFGLCVTKQVGLFNWLPATVYFMFCCYMLAEPGKWGPHSPLQDVAALGYEVKAKDRAWSL